MSAFRLLVLSFVILVSWAIGSSAAVPTSITVQGKLTDAGGAPLPAGAKTFTFRIFDLATLGTQIWPSTGGEIQSITSSTDGLWIGLVGAVSPLNDLVFADSVRWLEINVNGTTLPRVRLVNEPYSFRVATVDGASGGTITSKVSIGPGHTNTGADAFVAGSQNVVSGDYSSVPGGNVNAATEVGAVVGGGVGNTASGYSSVVGGGVGNTASGYSSAIAGGESNAASQNFAAIGGGFANVASAGESNVGGGNSNTASGHFSTVGGGVQNIGDDTASVIGGGRNNRARGAYSVVGGGGGSDPADSNAAAGDQSAIAGGLRNIASGNAAAVGGGYGNTASDFYTTVGGGLLNTASGYEATVGGGQDNAASAFYTTVGGGVRDTASSFAATVGGGLQNTASGPFATVPGGSENVASGMFSFAAGAHAKALHDGTFVWSSGNSFSSTGINEFLINAPGGVGIGTNAPGKALQIGDHSTPGSEGMIRFESRSNVGGNARSWEIGVPQTGSDATGKGYAFVIDDTQLGIDPEVTVDWGTGYMGLGVVDATNRIQLPNTDDDGGSGIANAWTVYSSRRWKTNIVEIADPLEKVQRLRGVTYDWKADGKHDIGLIAEEVGEVIPEVVAYEQNGIDAKSVDYSRLVALLIEGMKEQQKQIAAQQLQIDLLKTEVRRQTP